MRKTRGVLALAVSAGVAVRGLFERRGQQRGAVRGRLDGPVGRGVGGRGESAAALTPVRLQLQWAPQAQFAGYFAAEEQGYYEAEGST